MTQVTVTISGRSYRMACDDGQEAHLTGLGDMLESRIVQLRESFGEIGEMRLHVMAGIMLADELTEAKRKIAAMEASVRDAEVTTQQAAERLKAQDAGIAGALGLAADRLERIARDLGASGGAHGTH